MIVDDMEGLWTWDGEDDDLVITGIIMGNIIYKYIYWQMIIKYL